MTGASNPVTGGTPVAVNSGTPQALSGLRVIELASPLTHYCGKMFAELGAEVILVEPPGGSATRSAGPHIGGMPGSTDGASHSLSFSYLNTSKRSITISASRSTCTLCPGGQ